MLDQAELTDRFWSKVEKAEDGCWLWTSTISRHGYGRFHLAGRHRAAHRVAYTAMVGPIPDGLDLDHLCRVRHCVNPDHLEPVTHGENLLRGTGPVAVNAAATHCPQGHPYNEANTYAAPSGRRHCRTCRRQWKREENQRRREERANGD